MTVTLNTLKTGRRIRVRGLVQGVGFRPTVWHLAHQHGLSGQVFNDGEGVLVRAWGFTTQLEKFIAALSRECPPLARIDSIEHELLIDEEFINNVPSDFNILESQHSESHTGVVPDAATCPTCVSDIFNSDNRRFRYPFTNCTHCGPRLSIITSIPYDRSNTSMSTFKLCLDCQAEYHHPVDRRFHAQPNACHKCGPRVWLSPAINTITAIDDIDAASVLLKQGKILAIKGIGGFHLACDATNKNTVQRLRDRKQRYAKPFALMAKNINVIKNYCHLDDAEEKLLYSSAAPIVLLDVLPTTCLSSAIAPEQSVLGFMLPYTPLHHLLLQNMEHPIVMTSGNLSENPQCINNDDAMIQLKDIADFWLLHDRDIRNRIDDSVTRIVNGTPRLLRRARGYAPTSFPLPPGFEKTPDILTFGSELKNTFCLIKDGQAILSQHMGDLENASTYIDYEKNINLYQHLFSHQPTTLVVDAHPEYLSSKLGRDHAKTEQLSLIEVQHHHAHIAACLADNNWPLDGGKVLGIALDGLGMGEDNTLWGGEFLLTDYKSSERLASFKPVPLIGASLAMSEPWRNTYAHLMMALGWNKLHRQYKNLELVSYLDKKPRTTIDAILNKGMNSPLASSCGRLFDAVAAAVGLSQDKVMYEGQAAIELEMLVKQNVLNNEELHAYPFNIDIQPKTGLLFIEPRPMWQALLTDLQTNIASHIISARFHLGLAKIIVKMIEQLYTKIKNDKTQTIVLTGGVFQNRILFEQVTQRLHNVGYHVLSHSRVPANDGGIALGQAMVALAQIINKETQSCA